MNNTLKNVKDAAFYVDTVFDNFALRMFYIAKDIEGEFREDGSPKKMQGGIRIKRLKLKDTDVDIDEQIELPFDPILYMHIISILSDMVSHYLKRIKIK